MSKVEIVRDRDTGAEVKIHTGPVNQMPASCPELESKQQHFYGEARRISIYNEIENERVRQDGLWGTAFDDSNTANDWAKYVADYAGASAPLKLDILNFEHKMMQAAALCIAAIEASRRNGGPAPRHYDPPRLGDGPYQLNLTEAEAAEMFLSAADAWQDGRGGPPQRLLDRLAKLIPDFVKRFSYLPMFAKIAPDLKKLNDKTDAELAS